MRNMSVKTLVPNSAWLVTDFLSDDDFQYLHDQYVGKQLDMIHINNADFKPLMADTDMSYRAVTMDIYKPIYDALEPIVNDHFEQSLPLEKTSGLNMQYKRFEQDDFYALHAEDRSKYGDVVYIMYLSDESDGELVLPSFEDAQKEWSTGFQEMTEQFSITFADNTVTVTPQANTCVIMRTGLAHIVRRCSGSRDSIAGWPFFKKKV